MEALIRKLLVEIGEDPDRAGLEKTPQRVAGMWGEMTAGQGRDGTALLAEATFDDPSTGMVVCRDIDFVSLCEHHLLPFFGRATIAYYPDGRLVGISKLARVTDLYARRLQVQERMGQQVLDAMVAALSPRGALVHIEATHLCMVARGVKLANARMVTTHASGLFEERPELLSAVLGGGR